MDSVFAALCVARRRSPRAAVPSAEEPAAAAPSTKSPVRQLGAGEGAVTIIAWAGYIERGETDKAYDWVTAFEQKTGCKVSVKIAATSDEMVALMNEGGFIDLVTASGDASNRLISGGRVQELNLGLVPELGERRPPPAERPLAHRGRQALRRALPVGTERAHVQHQGLRQQGSEQLERGVRGDDPA